MGRPTNGGRTPVGTEAEERRPDGRRDGRGETRTRSSASIGSDYAEQVRLPRTPTTPKDYFFKSGRGLSHEVVEAISEHKNEPEWMRKFRHKALDYFFARPMPTWGGDVSGIDFDNIYYYIKPTEKQGKTLGRPAGRHQGHLRQAGHPRGREEVPRRRRRPVRVRGRLPQPAGGPAEEGRASSSTPTRACASTRSSSSSTSGRSSRIERQQVRRAEHGRLVGRLVRLRPDGRQDRPAAAGLLPDQRREHGPVRAHADHRRRGRLGPLRRGLHGADLLERELHSAVVEIVVKKGGRCRYTTIQNWSNNVYNLVTKRAVAYEDATMEWVDGNLGSRS